MKGRRHNKIGKKKLSQIRTLKRTLTQYEDSIFECHQSSDKFARRFDFVIKCEDESHEPMIDLRGLH